MTTRFEIPADRKRVREREKEREKVRERERGITGIPNNPETEKGSRE